VAGLELFSGATADSPRRSILEPLYFEKMIFNLYLRLLLWRNGSALDFYFDNLKAAGSSPARRFFFFLFLCWISLPF
jgi:hypothetical protein